MGANSESHAAVSAGRLGDLTFVDAELTQLGRDVPAIVPAGTLYVAIHPFFNENKPLYSDRIAELISGAKAPILTLDGGRQTAAKYVALDPQGPRYFLPNGFCDSRPHCGWETTAEVIRAFEPREVIFVGSQLMGNEEEGYAQCVGYAFQNLRERVPGARLNESICDRID